MATAKYQAWTNATWAWDSAAAGTPCVELEAELDAWIAAVNLNASQSGKQVVKIRGAADSTTANYRGWGVELPAQNTTGSLYVRTFSAGSTVLRFYASTGFTDDTSNGGYGNATGTVGSDTSIAWKNTVTTDGSFIIGYSTVNGEEFFHWGWAIDSSSSTSDSVTIAKDQSGEWMAYCTDSTSVSGLGYDDLQPTPGWVLLQGFDSATFSSVASRPSITRTTAGLSTGNSCRFYFSPASTDLLYSSGGVTQGSYTTITGSSDNLVRTAYYGQIIRYTPV